MQKTTLEKTQQDIKLIGLYKYKFLKSKQESELTSEEKEQIWNYEKQHIPSQNEIDYVKYHVNNQLKKREKDNYVFRANTAYVQFRVSYNEFLQEENSKQTELIEDPMMIENLKTLLFYFAKDKRFFESQALVKRDLVYGNTKKSSTPSFDKGLLIIGNFGTGKTSTMKVLHKMFSDLKHHKFQYASANDLVRKFESWNKNLQAFWDDVLQGDWLFDDVKTERFAKDFGKLNLFKEILESRETKKHRYKTYVLGNYHPDHPNNLEMALVEYGEKYGGRVFDRLFSQFNIIQWQGNQSKR
ncbi:ATP-binding protein [Aureivirga marina]|uniref:ATP-binding protein n=1 Tax=Aureivirga marina TaxID=1182451 RepID=UPI0018C9355A|nr:ATP-binding protein [Aureivirga marina]